MKQIFLCCATFLLLSYSLFAQGRQNDIPPAELPEQVKQVLWRYVEILETAQNLEECADLFVSIAGGSLVNEDGQSLRASVKPYSLKKDYENIKFYQKPLRITRVNVRKSNGTGFGASAVRGEVYKIWIDKKAGVGGMPAPISIIKPEGHAQIKVPKVINIGSL